MRTSSNPMESTCDVQHVETRAISVGAWMVLASAFVGWMFDAMDLQLFTMIMLPALRDLLGPAGSNPAQIGGLIIGAKLLSWGVGGIIFGVLADRVGRARVMLATMVIYSIFTAASALAQNWHQLLVLQMISGLGIGGEWAAGAALVVETWPEKHRAKAVQVMQAAGVVGLILASAFTIVLSGLGWRWILAMGAAPAVVSLGLRFVTPESARWQRSHEAALLHRGPKMGSLSEIFGMPLRRRTLVGSLIAAAMMIGSWGGAVLFPVLLQVMSPGLSAVELTHQTGVTFMAMNAGAVLGFASTLVVVWLWPRISRRAVYVSYCAGAWIATIFLYTAGTTIPMFRVAIFLFGYFAIGGFGIVALYLTELFPVHLRATGQGFSWNVGRLFTAIGPLTISAASATFGLNAVGIAIATAFGMGLLAVAFGPETGR